MDGYPMMGFLEDHGVRLSGPVEVVRQRPWSLVAKVPTASGLLWFKENRGQTRYEAALLQALARWMPGQVPEVVAVDAGRGWSLTRDGGPTLREVGGGPDPAGWERMLAGHAEFQNALAGRCEALLALGVPDQRPGLTGQLWDTLPVPDTVSACKPRLLELCEVLQASPVPASLQHDDLHDGNVFAGGRVFDWGDASVSHPFGVLLVSLRVAGERFGAGVVPRLRDAYLEPWTSLAARAELVRVAQAAVQVAKVGRALSWRRALAGLPAGLPAGSAPQERARWGDPVTAWLEELLT